MNNFIKKSAYFTIFSAVIILLVDFYFNLNYYDGSRTKINKLINCDLKKDICFFGDSKNQWNFDYFTLKKNFPDLTFFNYSLPGFNFEDIIAFYGKDLCNCKYFVININESNLANSIINNKFAYIFDSTSLFDFIKPIDFYKNQKERNRLKYDSINIINGFLSIKNKRNSLKESVKISQEEILQIKNNSEIIFKDFYRLIDGKKVLFIKHNGKTFRKIFFRDKLGENFLIDIFKNIFINYHLINYESYPEIIDEDYFYDNVHLNDKGSIFFTKIFIKDLKNFIDE